MPTTPCVPNSRFDFHPHRALDLTHDAPQTSSDGGLLLLRQLDERLGLAGRVAALLRCCPIGALPSALFTPALSRYASACSRSRSGTRTMQGNLIT